MADINIQEVTNHINIETANGYNLEFNGPVVNMNVVLSNYYTKTETDALLNDKADKADTYTKSETNILLNDKADKADTYTISQINGMVQDINTAIDTKQNLITGAASTITNSNLTANRVVISNASGKVAVSNVTSTELGYVSGVTSEVQTQLNNKASTSLDNLSAAGQMIINSQNGTISNCILEIPQNLNLTLENNVLTVKSGSILTLTGSTYATATTNHDVARTYNSLADGRYFIFMAGNLNSLGSAREISVVGSGDTVPDSSSSLTAFYNIADKKMYQKENNVWTVWNVAYPLCIIEASDGAVSFAKDSNGNDMIFNGMGFIGHHAFIYPDLDGLQSYGTNNGVLSSNPLKLTTLSIVELNNNRNSIFAYGVTTVATRNYIGEYNTVSEASTTITSGIPTVYIKSENKHYQFSNSQWSTDTIIQKGLLLLTYAYNGTTVTDFAIRQPYQGARNLLTDDLYKQIGDVETLLATV